MDRRPSLRRRAAWLIVIAVAGSVAACGGVPLGVSPTGGTIAVATTDPMPGSDVSSSGDTASAGNDRSPTAADPTRAPDPTTTPTTTPAPTPKPSATPTPTLGLDPPPTRGPIAMDLYRPGDFVTEMRPIWCAPAALQTMINIMSPGADRSRARQKELHALARKLGPAPDRGSEPEGEAKALDASGYGPYRVIVARNPALAIKAAARAIRLTGRPVALLVWRGAHNWVVSGFRATADPALTNDFRVTYLRIEDVWYPRISSIWGESRPPDSLVPVGLMTEDYLPWHRPSGRYPGKDGRFVLVIPVAAA